MNFERERRVLFVRPGPIGNTLAAVPALRAIRKAWPTAKITILVEKIGRETLKGCPYADDFIVYEKRGDQKGPLGFLKTVIALRKREFTHVIVSKRFFRMSFLASLTGAPVRVGFANYGYKLTEEIAWVAARSVIQTNLDLVAALGVQPDGMALDIWPSAKDEAEAEKFLADNGLTGNKRIVAIHATGVSQKDKGWAIANWAELAVAVEKQYGLSPIFFGTKNESAMMDEISKTAGRRYPFSGDAGLNVRASASVIKKSLLFMGADSGPSHLAQAVGTPGVIYYGPQPDWETNLKRWKPEGKMYVAVAPHADGTHIEPREMLVHVAEIVHRIHESGRWPE